MKHIWTKKGLSRLGKIIRQSREAKRLGLREAAGLISSASEVSVAFPTLASVERGSFEAKYNTLAAIAASGLIEYDGKTLDIFDFIAIASEQFKSKGVIKMEALTELIRLYMNQNQLSVQQFASICRIPFLDIEAILAGEQPAEFENCLVKISAQLINPGTGERFKSYLELTEYCNLKKNDLTSKWEQSHLLNGLNGYSR